MKKLLPLLFCLSALSLPAQEKPWQTISLTHIDGAPFQMTQVGKQPLSVFFFLSPECPLCENYSLTINQLRKLFPKEKLVFYGVFPGKFYSKEQIQTYLTTYSPQVTPLLDPDYQLKKAFGARVTPEVFLLNSASSLLYSGKIDNWVFALGKKRVHVTEFYLRDAISAALAGRQIEITHVDAIGCFIE
ncbi:MAG: hypothetical protein EAZ89_14280 [Bacteroidetes bacterium]|nr:MAG: hypothetical protein EAZ89_14280 [Bacteroidota bacterium]